MAPNPEIRASDADRDRVAESLRDHCGEGRITVDELQERLEAVYAAKTLGELQDVTFDLPEKDLYQLPVPASQAKSTEPAVRRSSSGDVESQRIRTMWGFWALVNVINFAVWSVLMVQGSGTVYPWWIWVAGPWGALLLLRTIFGDRRG
ncbi:uncharacterized protein DUF1707 [Actinomadura pelletieri DSM 43383]|uniref:Uncharacterized protein DUF1707 n=1 Tax=Actinomadura pelletieri DSM 43383 TaxID=1120940 RepID=A0A495QRK5_9ACTN|nr:DUF1707 domain-containing protein [Actinomadura pelletieri]RKS76118.1 uncharacterized protein DUF1707 [Actinomadura pelletieri DSM 43383]